MNFTHLHVHSNYSLCSGASTVEELCQAAQTQNMSHLALTDTNGIYGLVFFIQTAKRYNITPLKGAHLKVGDHECVMLARNIDGYRYLCKTLSRIHCENDFSLTQLVDDPSDDVYILSYSVELLSALSHNFSHLYAELVPHKNYEKVLKFSRQHEIPVVATNAVHFRNLEDWTKHHVLRAIDKNTTLERLDESELASKESWFKSLEILEKYYPACPEALENTLKIAQDCEFELDFKNFIFTSYKGPEGQDAFTLLRENVEQGIKWRYGQKTEKIQKRLDYELDIINRKGFAQYFLVVQDVVRKAPRTCGRGSAAASLVSYCLGITHVDPIKYDLFFERFLNEGRTDPPDIDVDFPWDERDEILDYIFKKYGQENTAMVANHNSFKMRSAAREVAKVFGLPDAEISSVTKKISGFFDHSDFENLVKENPRFKGTFMSSIWAEIFTIAQQIVGYPRHLSVHCGGVVIAPDGLDNYVPRQPAKKQLNLDGIPKNLAHPVYVIQWEKDQSEDMGLIKMDILGNRSLAVIRDALANLKSKNIADINYATWNPIDNEKTQKLLANGESMGVFYVESPATRILQKKAGVGTFERLTVHSSIIRPAANTYINEYVRRLKGGEYEPLHPLLDKVLAETFGIMVYQEDVSIVAMKLAGFSAADADTLRKIISKKHKEKELADYQKQFYDGALANGVTAQSCKDIWDMILSFAGYSFCKPHSASYALVSFKSAYLKAHYPAEFMAAVISNRGGYYSAFAYISEARRLGLDVLMPDINKSELKFAAEGNAIRIGFMQFNDISKNTLHETLDERENGNYKSFDDFLSRITIKPNDIAILIKAGCFDDLEQHKTRPELLWKLKFLNAEKGYKKQTTLDMFSEVTLVQTNLPKPPEYDARTVDQNEMDVLGYLLSKHPLTMYQERLEPLNYIRAVDIGKYENKRVTMIGWFITGKLVKTKHNDRMEFMSFEDTTDIFDTIFFPKTYSKFIYMISKTRPYVLKGEVKKSYGVPALIVDHVAFL